jgi:hypothetical protein
MTDIFILVIDCLVVTAVADHCLTLIAFFKELGFVFAVLADLLALVIWGVLAEAG